MEIISGKMIADELTSTLKAANIADGIEPCLVILDIGDNPDNKRYIGLKTKAASAIGGTTRILSMPGEVPKKQVLDQISALNQDPNVHGILLQLPVSESLQPHQDVLLAAIDPAKDVDGFTPHNLGMLLSGEPLYVSCAAMACLNVCRRYAGPLPGKRILLVGDSFDVIQSLAIILIKEGCNVMVTPEYDSSYLPNSDIAIIEKGAPGIVKASNVKEGALLIDAGFYWADGRTCGNIDKSQMGGINGYLLPVPGGMGPLLIAHLMDNLCRAASRIMKG